MSLRFALLAILRVGPLSGYDLAKQFGQSVGNVWYAPDSQIYPELRRMEVDGLVVAEEQTRGERGRRRLYHVTELGQSAFLEWAASPLEYQRVRDPAHLRAAYLEATTPQAAREFLQRHIVEWTNELAQFDGQLRQTDELTSPLLVRRLAVTAPEDRERTIAFKRFAYEGLVQRAHMEIEWAQRGLELLDRLPGAHPVVVPSPAGPEDV
jgi:PadR family transcriptional regulator AphA